METKLIIEHTTPISDEELTAAAIAIKLCLADEAALALAAAEGAHNPADAPWQTAALLISQGVPPHRFPQRPGWSDVERLRRIGGGGYGITGL